MPFPFRWVREARWRSTPGQVIALEMDPRRVVPFVSVQAEWHGCRGIIRGAREEGLLLEDHIREELRGGRPVDAGRRIVGADDVRGQVWTARRHAAEHAARHPGEVLAAWAGNGNLLSNPHFVAFAGGRLFHLGSEAALLSTRSYSSLLVRKPGRGPRVTIETLGYEASPSEARVFNSAGEDITADVESATFGQQIVRDGRPAGAAELNRMAAAGQFYDLRHLFLFGRIPTGDQRWLDAGLSAFWDERGGLDAPALEAAMDGEPVVVEAGQFDPVTVRAAMDAKGYDPVETPGRPGEYSLRDRTLRVVLLEGIYPHNMIGVREDGTVLSVVIRGLSNRVGLTLRGAAETMALLGARDALLLDNGGDVMMGFGDDRVLGSAEGDRDRLKSMLLFCRRKDASEQRPEDLRLVHYPKQYRAAGTVPE